LTGGLAHQVRSIEARPLASFFARGGPLSEELCDYFASFAIIISYLYDPDRIFETNVASCSEAQFLVGPHRPDERGAIHATRAFLQPLERLAIFDADETPRLHLAAAGSAEAQAAGNGQPKADDRGAPAREAANAPSENDESAWLALHPGSGSERKNWPEENWAELLARLVTETDFHFLLVGGEAEGERLSRLAARIPRGRVKLAQSLPLLDLAFLLKSARAYLGHDSGISHLAAAVGLRGIMLWGGSREEVWRPKSDRMQILRSPEGVAGLPIETVFAALREQALAGPA
jgi:heptosyltransferase-2